MTLHLGAGNTILIAALVTFLIWRLVKSERRAALTALGFFSLAMGGLALSSFLARHELLDAAQFVRGCSLLVEGLSLISLTGTFLFRLVMPVSRFPSPRILQDVVVGISFFVWFLFWLRSNRVDLTQIIATSAVVTAVIGFSLQDTLGNILGGVALQADQSVQVGDWIKVDDVVGRVVEIRWRHTSIETRDWETVVIPNSQLLKTKFLVLGRRQGEPNQWRRYIYFNVDFRVSPFEVMETVGKAIREAQLDYVAARPEPNCVMMDFAESYARYALRYWITDPGVDHLVDSSIRARIYLALRRAGLDPSIPAQAIFVTEDTERRRQNKAERRLAEREAAIQRIDLLDGLAPDEHRVLAERLVPTPFAPGDVIIRQGEMADWLYVVMRGVADVMVVSDAGVMAHVAELGPGSFFGEMGLITGEARSATVVAQSQMDCYRLDKEAFQEIVLSRPAIAEEICNILTARRMELDAARENLDAKTRAERLETTHDLLRTRIRQFLGLGD